MRSHITRRHQAQRFNAVIDEALIAPSPQQQQQVLQLTTECPVAKLAERVRRRATLLGKRQRGDGGKILSARDALILALYASLIPPGWACAWSDGSSVKVNANRHAGIGGIVMDSNGTILARISRPAGELTAFDAEIAALAAVISTAVESRQQRLRVYTDNYGLAQLWREKRNDKRLEKIRELGAKLERLSVFPVPRLHNQPANALARQAVT
jgi:ribonuclease HI